VPGNITYVPKTTSRLKMSKEWSDLKSAVLGVLLTSAQGWPLMKLLVNESGLHDTTLAATITALRGKLMEHAGHQPNQQKGLAAAQRMKDNNPVHLRVQRWAAGILYNAFKLIYIYIYVQKYY
jgi:hypothetical protein